MSLNPKQIAGLVLLVAGIAVLACVPFLVGRYLVSLFISMLAFSVLTMAWSAFSGPTRYISLATSAFYGVGIYCVAIFNESMPLPLILVLAALVSFGLALLIGLSTLRLSGIYFVIFTFGLAELTRQLMTWYEINQTKSLSRYIFATVDSHDIYWMLLVLAVATLFLTWLLQRSRLGFALRVVGEDETVARHSGINTTWIKVLIFAFTSMLMGLTGAIVSLRWTYVDPNVAFNSFVSFQVLIMALLGGIGRLHGPILGVVPLVLLSEYLSGSFPYHFTIVLGICFIIIVFYMPTGVAGLLDRLFARLGWRTVA
ncbi:branched-chain amino acid ABC transporter permease [Marinibaculum pumilum]|uniref:Branched-chain amino acid ABC transporter permease n=1 Tax=Marinibaculum pumilum TaxID=1766165 RepID=A0ABV7L7N5_9PROT